MDPSFLLKRKIFSDRSTIGELWHYGYEGDPGEMLCFILEDECRADGVKIPGKTAIPAGDYKIKVTPSSRFKRDLPIVYNVDSDMSVTDGVHTWAGIRMHPGNTDVDTEGCQLPGSSKGTDIVYGSRDAFDGVVLPAIQKALQGRQFVNYKVIIQQESPKV